MTPEEIAGVVAVVATAFGRSVTDTMLDVYAAALEDLEVPDPVRLATTLARVSEKWVSPATIRRHVLASCGLLALDEDEAWVQAVRWAAFHGDPEDRPVLDVEVREAVEAVGGSWGLRMGTETTIRAQFRDAYRRVKARADEATMVRSWKGLPLNPGGHLQLTYGRDHDLDPGEGRE